MTRLLPTLSTRSRLFAVLSGIGLSGIGLSGCSDSPSHGPVYSAGDPVHGGNPVAGDAPSGSPQGPGSANGTSPGVLPGTPLPGSPGVDPTTGLPIPAGPGSVGSPVPGGQAGGAAGPDGTGGAASPGAGGAGTIPGAGGGLGTPTLTRGPTPADGNANFPFPQNRESSHCSYPTNYDNQDVVRAFDKWRTDTVTADGAGGHLRVKRPMEPGLEVNSTVSEGIAYGMLIAVYMNEQEMFDEFRKYEQLWLDGNGLMNWYINAAGTEVLGGGAASDADIDIAWALVMADRQWGGQGSLDRPYIDHARELIDRIWAHEIMDGKLLKAGDSWGDWSSVNVSYFMPNYFRVFGEVSGNAGWNDVVVTSYDTLENTLNDANGNTANGLVPAWATSEGVPNAGVWGGNDAPTHYQYDSCRTPFRIGVDYCFHAEPRALDYVSKTTQFFAGIGVASIVDGYDLNGTPRPQFPDGQSAAFIGPAGVGAMAVPNQTLLDDAYNAVKGLDLLTGGTYYDLSWTVLSLLMMTGNFIDYTQHQPL